jgi:hypothetical protein
MDMGVLKLQAPMAWPCPVIAVSVVFRLCIGSLKQPVMGEDEARSCPSSAKVLPMQSSEGKEIEKALEYGEPQNTAAKG